MEKTNIKGALLRVLMVLLLLTCYGVVNRSGILDSVSSASGSGGRSRENCYF